MQNENKHLVQKEDFPDYFTGNQPEVLLTMGAGDIDTLVEPIENFFRTNKNK
jgi:UDP-N-acetylmuramate--alanine ligase